MLAIPEQSEVVKLGMPMSGEVAITVDPGRVGTPYVAGTETLQPGAEVPVHRQLDRDQALFIHKGQGRMVLNEQILNVTPGKMVFVPRGVWYGLRNTGTGRLQIAWIASPPGLEVFFRECSQLGATPSLEAVQALAQRYRIELRPPSEGASSAASPRSRSSRGGRRRRRSRGARVRSELPAARVERRTKSGAPSAVPSSVPSSPRSRGRRRGARRRPGAATQGPPAPSSPSPSTRSRASRGGYRRRVKEVYIDGRWVQVEGGKPVIALGGKDKPSD